MKNSEKKVKIKVRPKRLTRRQKRDAKLAAKAREQLILCQQAAAFHKAYLEIEYGIEEAKFEAIQARLAELQPTVETVITQEEEIEAVAEFQGPDSTEEDAFTSGKEVIEI